MSTPNDDIASKMLAEKELEKNAKTARAFLVEYDVLMLRMVAFMKATSPQPQDPLNHCRNLVLSYGFLKLDDKTIQLGN
jgi:hypothetical protein